MALAKRFRSSLVLKGGMAVSKGGTAREGVQVLGQVGCLTRRTYDTSIGCTEEEVAGAVVGGRAGQGGGLASVKSEEGTRG